MSGIFYFLLICGRFWDVGLDRISNGVVRSFDLGYNVLDDLFRLWYVSIDTFFMTCAYTNPTNEFSPTIPNATKNHKTHEDLGEPHCFSFFLSFVAMQALPCASHTSFASASMTKKEFYARSRFLSTAFTYSP